MTFSYKSLYRFDVCGHKIRISLNNLNDSYYVQKYINHAWRNLHPFGFESFAVALDYALARSRSTIIAGAYASQIAK